MLGKILVTKIREEIFYWLVNRGLFPVEHKWCCRQSRGTDDLPYIYHILKKAKTKRKIKPWCVLTTKRPMIWFRKLQIIESLEMYKISDKIINFITNAMENWRVEWIVRGQTQTEVRIFRGISQRDLPLPLQFVIAMINIFAKNKRSRRFWYNQ